MREFDSFVVIGSGIAGLTFAAKAAKHWPGSSIVTTLKGGDSKHAWAKGGVACVTSYEDAFGLHSARSEGRGLRSGRVATW